MISVIIPTYNRAALLQATLDSLTKQTVRETDFEVLVIDNGSSDNTRDMVSKHSIARSNVRYLHEPAPGLHAGRHRGLYESKGSILAFADDDIEAFPTWLEGIQESFRDKKVAMAGGKNIPLYEATPPAWIDALWETTVHGRYMTYFSLLDFGDDLKEVEPYFVFGCNFSIRKDVLVSIKGFHPDGMPSSLLQYRGDGETFVAREVKKAGYITLYNPKASVKHWVPASRMNLDYLNKRAFAEGVTHSYIDTRKKYLDALSESRVRTTMSKMRKELSILFSSTLKRALHRSFSDGYRFHQEALKKDKALMDWVLKENYLP
jgi:glycosyltransferase involved in cell wall biosynthesis